MGTPYEDLIIEQYRATIAALEAEKDHEQASAEFWRGQLRKVRDVLVSANLWPEGMTVWAAVQGVIAERDALRAERGTLVEQVAALQGERAEQSATITSMEKIIKRLQNHVTALTGVRHERDTANVNLVHTEAERDNARAWAALWKRAAKSRQAHERDYILIKAENEAVYHVWAQQHAALEPTPDDFANAPDLPTTPEAPAINEVH